MSYRFRVRDLALLVAVVAIILQGGLTASAATVTWTGSGTNTGYYSDGLNWDTSAVPTSADDAVIGLAGTVYINSGDALYRHQPHDQRRRHGDVPGQVWR